MMKDGCWILVNHGSHGSVATELFSLIKVIYLVASFTQIW